MVADSTDTTTATTAESGPVGTLDAALGHAQALLMSAPAMALAQTREILRVVPGHPQAILIEGQALRVTGQFAEALGVLARLAAEQPRSAATACELGLTLLALDRPRDAMAALRRAVALKPDLAPAWAALADTLRAQGNEAEACAADVSAIQAASRDPVLLRAAAALGEAQFDSAEALLAGRLQANPRDAAALRMLGEIAWRKGDLQEAVALLNRTLAIAPGFGAARELLVRILALGPGVADAIPHARRLVADAPREAGHALLLASLLVRTGEQEEARTLYRHLVSHGGDQPRVWMNLGHVEKTLGHQADAIAAYRRAIAQNPALGEAWWSLANLKTVKLDAADIATMSTALASVTDEEEAAQLHFALGKAHEDAAEAEASFAHYARGNALRRQQVEYDGAEVTRAVADHAALFTAPFLAAHAAQGCPARDPIFVVGLPRSGSTLVEQILSSHSQIEGTMELPDLMMLADRLQARIDSGEFASLGAVLASLAPADLARLGEEYIERTRVHRKTDKPLFIDKMPNNWQHVGLIRLILPNATIIDARRHPMGCCFSGWKQHFARGQVFTYDLAEIGHYYRDYVAQMAAFDRQAPGAVHRVIYERMVADTEGEVRRLLAHVGVPFEDACLNFWQNRRAVRTASSEQVRQPIFTDGVDHWKLFEPWLGPLRDALGDVATAYPDVPARI